MNGEHKITSSHRERTALIYLRQSSMAQVREHTESTRGQYGLAETAAGLGWARTSIEVIDTDLGISGKWGVAREGFTELVTRVCSGDVGAIFGIEITRLARSNADVARLAEFARITGTLLIDPDGVYDPADVNNRVLWASRAPWGRCYADIRIMPLMRTSPLCRPGSGSTRRAAVTVRTFGIITVRRGTRVCRRQAGSGRV